MKEIEEQNENQQRGLEVGKPQIDKGLQEQQLILRLTDEKTEQRKKLSKHDEDVIKSIGGQVISIPEFLLLVETSRQPYESRFPKSLYVLVCKLNGWPEEWAASYTERAKHVGFKHFTTEVIYGRYLDGILQYLQLKRKYISYSMGRDKLFQFLSKKGIELLEQYLKETIKVMEVSENMVGFRLQMLKDYGLPYQTKMNLI